MAVLGTMFNWVRVSSGVWTVIGRGPLIQGFPLQALELIPATPGPKLVSVTLDGYSASPPFYERDTNTVDMTGEGIMTSTPIGHTGNYALVLAYSVSPWVEFWLLLNRSCFAHISML